MPYDPAVVLGRFRRIDCLHLEDAEDVPNRQRTKTSGKHNLSLLLFYSDSFFGSSTVKMEELLSSVTMINFCQIALLYIITSPHHTPVEYLKSHILLALLAAQRQCGER
jgi:hypothetical protein